jgi:hypothetical protein
MSHKKAFSKAESLSLLDQDRIYYVVFSALETYDVIPSDKYFGIDENIVGKYLNGKMVEE